MPHASVCSYVQESQNLTVQEFFPSTAEVNAIWVHEVVSGYLNLPQRLLPDDFYPKADPSKNYSGLLSEVLAFPLG